MSSRLETALSSQAMDDSLLYNRYNSAPECSDCMSDRCADTRLGELEEASSRAQQMEAAMRWWSECTAEWRKKWSLVRSERNGYRTELQRTQDALEKTQKELAEFRREQKRREAARIATLDQFTQTTIEPVVVTIDSDVQTDPTAHQ